MFRWLAVALLLLAGVAAPVFAQDAHVGTWKQNFDKSTLTPAPTGPRPQSSVRTYEMSGDSLKATLVTVTADGTRNTATYTARFDGKDYPYQGAAAIDTIALKRIDANTFESTLKKAGKVVSTGTNTVSKDGKTMTYSNKGTISRGEPTSGVAIFEKQ